MPDEDKKVIRATMPSVASHDIQYESEEDLKAKICERFGIEPEFTNLIFVEKDEDLETISAEDLEDFDEDAETTPPQKEVIVDYIWARQMIVLKDDQKKLRKARVLVVGAGALGNEILKNLAWLGFGAITLVDFDVVEFSNVSRGVFTKDDIGKNKAQVLAERMGKSNPFVKIDFLSGRVEECLSDSEKYDVVLSALDNMPTRIWLSSFCVRGGIPLVDGGIKEFQGRVQAYVPEGPCLACNIPMDRYAEVMELKNPCEGVEMGAMASFSTVASIVAGIQANEAMKIVVGLHTLSGVLVMDFLRNNYSVIPLERSRGCFVCGNDMLKEGMVEDDGKS